MKNLKLTIQYDGTRYKGWQRQSESDMTIQGKIEAVLSRMTGENIEIIGSGRTDAGVHAKAQIANFKTNSSMTPEEIKDYCNTYLPEDIAIIKVDLVAPEFHSRYNAIEKTYQYILSIGSHPDVFTRKYNYRYTEKLDINLMKQASEYFIGEHDFQSFTTMKSKKKSTKRIINYIKIEENSGMLYITFNGNGFLYNMVRILTGTLLEIGSGRMSINNLSEIIAAKNRSLAGPTAPAQGLFLMEVIF